ncbi:hypothetical protein B0H13DRAFT_2373687 [Mycena leptocephala]|nr:hypothetical protein B0H13DRAFT_2373687 [Mycena leptocephala]
MGRTVTPKATKPKETKPGRKRPPTAQLDVLDKKKQNARSSFSQAPRTAKQYARYVEMGKEFLANVVAQRRERVEKEPSWICPQEIDTDVLAKAFEKPPNKHSVFALELFLTQKCIVEDNGKSTAEGVHGAFAKHWDTMDGDRYAGAYRFDEATEKVAGCPARAQVIQTFVKVIKNKSGVKGAAATRNHAEAMSIEDMGKWGEWSESKWPRAKVDEKPGIVSELQDKMKHFMMRAFGSSGFTLWTRNFELCALQVGDLTMDLVGPAPHNLPHFEVFLDNRKGWQNKQGFDNDSRESNRYNIYEQSDTPEIDMYTHLRLWLQLYEACLGRKLEADDYVFPYISANGVIHPSREMTTNGIQDLINEFCDGAGLVKSYTTHSFRRGGAQYRFMFAPFGKRWSLSIVRWWGGWASGEQVDTLMRYLMDSLQTYETRHSNALCPIPREADKSFMGDHLLLKPVDTGEFRLFTSQILKSLGDITSSAQSGFRMATGTMADIGGASAQFPSSSQRRPASPSGVNPNIAIPHIETAVPPAKKVKIIPGVYIPDLTKNDFAWKEAVRQWEEPNGRLPPLRDWPKKWYTGRMRTITGSKRNQRKLIAEEYYRLGSNDQTFVGTYQEASKRIGSLVKAIQDTNRDLGIGQTRRSKRGAGSDSDS